MTGRTLGVCYYPEHWPEERWAEDAARMARAGLGLVRIGEFAWSRLEPTPGDLRFDWLDRAIETLAAAGLKVVLGTPSATPPVWMFERHPDMAHVDPMGRAATHGGRRHYCFSHVGYRSEAARMARLLAERYGKHPALVAWQTDNEYGCHDTTLSYSSAALSGFRAWLSARYGQIDTLNQAWGTVFWSMEYRTYDDIPLPNTAMAEANPSHWLDFYRYSSDQVRDFNRAQVEAIRAHSDAPISHNYMGRVTEFDHFDLGADLEIATWDSYPLGFLEDRGEGTEAHKRAFARQGDPDFQAFHHDLYRAVGRGRWWVMEQQPGPVNWAPWNPAPLPGMVRLWAWEAFAHGAETVCYFRWRQAPFAQEQMHAGLLRADGAEAPGLEEATQVAREITQTPHAAPAPQVALVFDYQACWGTAIQPQGRDFDQFALVFAWYRALRSLGLGVDILAPDQAPLARHRLILAPGCLWWRDGQREAYAASGAQVLVGPRAGAKTQDFALPQTLAPDWAALGVTVTR
ncbi:MAG: beta-galactosidase, partial [Pseudomonadota bacterium]